ncbi:MAG: aminomethyl-transferring glycine dehydrogenase subunit GcvPA [Candidatus Riflebacteria bacterium]|nr:aminomethyl-transferring glycine dehydrogenase subunit GcvPA [Candidatus Riflebacteria bacterium]
MMSSYIPHTQDEIRAMLDFIGVKTVEDLFSEIPQSVRLNSPINLPEGISEVETVRKIRDLASQNLSTDELVCFLGGGIYDHHIPRAIDHILLRGDFYTAYTPYQPEISQGTLQAIYEYQSLICELTGMDLANASMYEGATATAEAANIALLHTGRKKIIISDSVHPEYRQVTSGLVKNLGIQVVGIPLEDGMTDLAKLKELIDDNTAAVIVQYPNFFGCLEEIDKISAIAKNAGALSIVSTYPIALGLLTPPGNLGADIVIGEGQSLGIPMSFGGPSLGFMAVKEPLLRKIPGRISGCTLDNRGQRGFVLTLQAREQHIRREKATSNICSNQALMALNATIYMSLLGREGIREVASHSLQKAHYLKRELAKLPKLHFPFTASFFNEFAVQIPNAKNVLKKLEKKGILGGIPLENFYPKFKDMVLIAVTEKRTAEEIHMLKELIGGLVE